MRIKISKNQFSLLTKRSSAAELAVSAAKTAHMLAQQAALGAEQAQQAVTDVVTCLTLDDGNSPMECSGYAFGEIESGEYFLEVKEKPAP